MADSTTFEVRLQDGVSGPADTAAQALAKLRSGLDRSRAELSSMNRAMRELKAGGVTGGKAFDELKAKIDAQKTKVGEYTAKYVELGGSFRKVKPPTKELSALAKVAQSMPGPIGKAASAMQGLSGWVVGGAVVGGIMAIVAGLGALAAAGVAAGVSLISYGIGQADARRSELLRLEGLARLRGGMEATAGVASAMQRSIDAVSDSSSASRSTLEGYAARIHRLGLRGDAATAALEGAAMRGEVLGQRYGESFIGMAAAAARSGQSVRALANDVEHRLGDLAARKFMALDVQARKFRENIAALFRNVKIDGFLKLLTEVVKGFSQARVTGRALAGIMERLFEPLNAGAAGAVGTVREGFGRIVLWALRVEGAFLAMQNAGLRALRMIGVQGGELRVSLAEIAGTVLLTMASLPILVVVGIGRAMIAGFMAMHAHATNAGKRLAEIFKGLNFRKIAGDLIAGFVAGIVTGGSAVISAVQSLGASTIAAIREILQIRSPSRVFARLGAEVPRGFAAGVDDAAPIANASVARMVDMSAADDAASAPSSPVARAGGSSTMTIQQLIVQSAATDAAGIADDIYGAVSRIFEDMLITRGEAT